MPICVLLDRIEACNLTHRALARHTRKAERIPIIDFTRRGRCVSSRRAGRATSPPWLQTPGIKRGPAPDSVRATHAEEMRIFCPHDPFEFELLRQSSEKSGASADETRHQRKRSSV
jgi:hypothetical protein